MKRIQYIGLVVLTFFLVSCGTTLKKQTEKTVNIESTSWQLAESVKGKTPTLMIKEGLVSGNAGCNNYSANVEMDASNGQLTIGLIRTTRMHCKGMMQGENSFLQMVKKANRYTVEDNVLKLYKDKVLLLKFRKK